MGEDGDSRSQIQKSERAISPCPLFHATSQMESLYQMSSTRRLFSFHRLLRRSAGSNGRMDDWLDLIVATRNGRSGRLEPSLDFFFVEKKDLTRYE